MAPEHAIAASAKVESRFIMEAKVRRAKANFKARAHNPATPALDVLNPLGGPPRSKTNHPPERKLWRITLQPLP
jgi:hypothetical protein